MTLAGFHNLPDCCADDVHLGGGKPVAARKIARRACLAHIAFYMRQRIINAVKPAWDFCGSAVDARLNDKCKNLGRGEIASVNTLVGRPKKHSPALVGLAVPLLAVAIFLALLWGHVRPAFFPAVPTFFAGVVAQLALVGQTERSCFFPMKVFRGRS